MPTALKKEAPLVEAKGILTQFGANIIHENLDFKVRRGEIVGLVGGSGSGKSVLLNTLLGLKEPEGGVVHYFGQDRRLLEPHIWLASRCLRQRFSRLIYLEE